MVILEHISKSFDSVPVLKDISISFQAGKTIALIGPSGSGKSTLLRCINLLEIPESGKLSINGQEICFDAAIKNKEILDMRRASGMVFQGFHLFPHRTVIENIIEAPVHVLKQPPEQAKQTARALLEKVGLADKADAYPDQLSGGQQQRTAIARALAMNPEFLLLDEPTSALDPELEAEVLKVLSAMSREGTSMLIVTHNLNFAQEVADEIVFLDQGGIQYRGTPRELFHECELPRVRDFISGMLPSFSDQT